MVITKTNIIRRVYLLLIFMSISAVTVPVLAATLQATVDRNPVNLDESFQLSLSIEGSVDGEPELDTLKKDFDILGRSQSSNLQIINGRMTQQSQWFITLMAKRLGKLIIPEIHVGADHSQKIIMTISPPQQTEQTNADVFLEVSVNTKESYIQEQLIYTVRLYRAVSLGNASLSMPRVNGAEAIIEKLGDDSEFETQRNGRGLRVIERRYAIFPQQSGKLTLEPVLFSGEIAKASSRYSRNPLFQEKRIKRLRSEMLTINVKPIPVTQANKPWLPARNMTMTETWQEVPPTFKVGEAVTRTITLTADGLTASELPEIKISMPAGIKHYSDQAVTNDQMNTTGIVGSRQQKIAIIPSQQGELTLPEIKLDWWNTKTQHSETLRIPSRTIQVMAANVSTSNAPADHPPSDLVVENYDQERREDIIESKAGPLETVKQAGFWPWLSLILVVGWFATFMIMRTQKKTLLSANDQEIAQSQEAILSKVSALSELKQTCFSNDPVMTKDAMLIWGKAYFIDSQVTSLADLASCTNDAIADELEKLNQVLYSKTSRSWKGEALWKLIDLYNKSDGTKKTTNNSKHVLAPLYP